MSESANRPNETGAGELKPVLGTVSLVAFGLAYLVPLTIFSTFGIVTVETKGHVPMAYIITTVAMLFTAMSYALLVRNHPAAGSAYTYAKRAFGNHMGFLTGWVLLLDYMLLPALNYLLTGIYINSLYPDIPQSVVILLAISIVTFLNIIGINFVRNTSLLLVLVQLLFAAVFVSLAIVRVTPETALMAPFYSDEFSLSAIFAGAAILCLSFLGFDAVSTLSEEAKEARKTVPRAILLTTIIGGSIFVTLSFAATHIIPDWRSINDPDAAAIQVVTTLGGQTLLPLFLATFLAGGFASAVASQASVSRILYAMGRDKVLPHGIFGVLNKRFNTPVRATLVVAAISVIVLVTPLDLIVSIISFGALFAFSLVNLAAFKFFIVDQKKTAPAQMALYGGIPLCGFAMTVWLWFSLSQNAIIVGVAWFLAGAVYLAVKPDQAVKALVEDDA